MTPLMKVRIDMERKADEAVVAAREGEKVKAEQTINDLRQRLQVGGVILWCDSLLERRDFVTHLVDVSMCLSPPKIKLLFMITISPYLTNNIHHSHPVPHL